MDEPTVVPCGVLAPPRVKLWRLLSAKVGDLSGHLSEISGGAGGRTCQGWHGAAHTTKADAGET